MSTLAQVTTLLVRFHMSIYFGSYVHIFLSDHLSFTCMPSLVFVLVRLSVFSYRTTFNFSYIFLPDAFIYLSISLLARISPSSLFLSR